MPGSSSSSADDTPTILEASRDSLSSGENVTKTFYLDDTLTGQLTVVMAYFDNPSFPGEATLTDPNGNQYNHSSSYFSDDSDAQQARFNISAADVSVKQHSIHSFHYGRFIFFLCTIMAHGHIWEQSAKKYRNTWGEHN